MEACIDFMPVDSMTYDIMKHSIDYDQVYLGLDFSAIDILVQWKWQFTLPSGALQSPDIKHVVDDIVSD